MKKLLVISTGIIYLLALMAHFSWAGGNSQLPGDKQAEVSETEVEESLNNPEGDAWQEDAWQEDAWEEEWEGVASIADPLEPLNRFFFHFNDKLYYWVLKPVARVYSGFLPDDLQIAIRNVFDNLRTPARAVSCLLQGRVRKSSEEVARFALNSTVGIFGVGDFAKDVLGLHSSYEDFGQTLAFYGAGGGFYINWPFLGPSNFRDSLGILGDAYMHPIIFLSDDWRVTIGAWTLDKVNYTALTLGDYELFTSTALDPYSAVKDAYQQYRHGLIENR